jgi:hypothetical protein
LVEILAALFDYAREHRQLMRMAFATAFTSPDELPKEVDIAAKCERNFEFIHSLVKRGLVEGVLDGNFDSKELAFGIHGLMNVYVMTHLLLPECKLDRLTAERVVQLFLVGAGAKPRAASRRKRGRRKF